MSQLGRLERTLVEAVERFAQIETGAEAWIGATRSSAPPGEIPTSFGFAVTLCDPVRLGRTFTISVVEVPKR